MILDSIIQIILKEKLEFISSPLVSLSDTSTGIDSPSASA